MKPSLHVRIMICGCVLLRVCRCTSLQMPLVVKHGGHPDQLSRRFWGMDRFRVQALCKLLESGMLSEEQRRLTVEMLRKKCTILAYGAQKRGHDGASYLALAAAYAK